MPRKLSIMRLTEGDVYATATLGDDGVVRFDTDDEDLLEDFLVIPGGEKPGDVLRPKDGEPYFNALKAMLDRASMVASFEPNEEERVRSLVEKFRAGEKRDAEALAKRRQGKAGL